MKSNMFAINFICLLNDLCGSVYCVCEKYETIIPFSRIHNRLTRTLFLHLWLIALKLRIVKNKLFFASNLYVISYGDIWKWHLRDALFLNLDVMDWWNFTHFLQIYRDDKKICIDFLKFEKIWIPKKLFTERKFKKLGIFYLI